MLYQPLEIALLDKGAVWVPDWEQEIYEYLKANPELLRQLPPRKFEELVASVFKNHGFDVELTPESRDGGFDVLAVARADLTGEKKYLVECKRYAEQNKVGVGIVRQLLGVVVDAQATMGIVATTSFFTRGALELEERRQDISLKDYNAVVGWLDRNQILPH